MDELVNRLATGSHPVQLLRYKDSEELAQRIEQNYVLVTFTETQGGTELGFELDTTRSEYQQEDLTQGVGKVTLVGELVLNFDRVRCTAEIDVATLKGSGHLEVLEENVGLV